MKKITAIIILLLTTFPIFSRERMKNNIYITVSPVAPIYDYKGTIDGGATYEGQISYALGLEYSREIITNLELLTGINYTRNKIDSESTYTGQEERFKESFSINYFSIPLQVKYHLTDFFFVNGGGIINLKAYSNSYVDREESDKFGILFGIGGKVDIKDRYALIINPYFQMNYLSSNRDIINFYNLGAKLGFAYKF